MGRTCFVQKLFLTFGTIYVHNIFSPCSAKRRASDKDLPVSFRKQAAGSRNSERIQEPKFRKNSRVKIQGRRMLKSHNDKTLILCSPSPKVWEFDEKMLHWASIVLAKIQADIKAKKEAPKIFSLLHL